MQILQKTNNRVQISPAPKVWFSTTVEALEGNIFPSSGWKRGNPQSTGRKTRIPKSTGWKKESPKSAGVKEEIPKSAGRVSPAQPETKLMYTTVLTKRKLLVSGYMLCS